MARALPRESFTGRRLGMAALYFSLIAAIAVLFYQVAAPGLPAAFVYGLDLLFLFSIGWTLLASLNAAWGFVQLRRPAPAAFGAAEPGGDERTAIVMTLRDEPPDEVFARLRAVKTSLERIGQSGRFSFFALSDSARPEMIAAEERAFALWKADCAPADQVVYRRRASNEGFKPGNIRDFLAQHGQDFEFMLLLDADSLMTGETIVELIAIMRARPRLGILQTLSVGILPSTLFARIFEFGHRHATRCTAAGAVWWQGDRCQFWGHNAVVRVGPFAKYCEMPYLPGKGPFSGHIVCHDQIEASFMHRAGFEVRVLPREVGSFEGVPPTLIEFTRRNHRWFQGNLKNLKVIGAPGLEWIDRFHLGVVAQRFLAWPAFVAFVVLSAVASLVWRHGAPFDAAKALWLYGLWLAALLAPTLIGVADAALGSGQRYGGLWRLALGAAVQSAFTILLTPVIMVAATIRIAGLPFGVAMTWDVQERDGYRLSWSSAIRQLWPQTALGLGLFVLLLALKPAALPWFAPFLAGLVLAAPFAVLTSSSAATAWAARMKLCGIPEDFDPPPEITEVEALQSSSALV